MNKNEKEELEQLRKEKVDRMHDDIKQLKECMNIISDGFSTSEQILLNVTRRIERLENKKKMKEQAGVPESMDRMFG